jgi:hypothetical protein
MKKKWRNAMLGKDDIERGRANNGKQKELREVWN